MIQIENFLSSYDQLKEYSVTAEFKTVENPVDKVKYPHICSDIPEHIRQEILDRIEREIGVKPENITMFMRRSPKGVSCPHIVHTDNSMGSYSLMLYMNDNEIGGTALVKHIETGMYSAPQTQEQLEIAREDQNSPKSWTITKIAKMKQNSAFIFDANLFHCALPIGGFGDGAESRTVLTVFFS